MAAYLFALGLALFGETDQYADRLRPPVLAYLGMVRELLESPAAPATELVDRVANIPPFISSEREDLQVLSFYAWLRARTLGRPYYEVLLELASVQ